MTHTALTRHTHVKHLFRKAQLVKETYLKNPLCFFWLGGSRGFGFLKSSGCEVVVLTGKKKSVIVGVALTVVVPYSA